MGATRKAKGDLVHAGKSILESFWSALDTYVEQLMADGEPGSVDTSDGGPDSPEEWDRAYAEWGRQQGRAEGMAFAIAIMTNPYRPDLPGIKDQAMERWERNNA